MTHVFTRLAAAASLLAMAAPLACAGQPDGEKPVPLKVMSFNIRYGSADDGGNSWPNRQHVVVNTVKEYEPAIVGLQEALQFQVMHMASEMPEYSWFGIGRSRNGGGEMTAVLYRWREVTPLHVGHFWLSPAPDEPGSRGWDAALERMVTWAEFFHIDTGRRFYCFNTHFDHRGEVARNESAALLARKVEEIAGSMPAVITGDFNAAGGASDPWNTAIESGLQDAWVEASETIGPTQTFSGFRAPRGEDGRRIDWILFRGPFSVERCETVLYNEDGRYPSDHYPIYAEMTILAREGEAP